MQAQMLKMISTQNDILAKLQLMLESVSGIAALNTGESHLVLDSGVQGECCPTLTHSVYHRWL